MKFSDINQFPHANYRITVNWDYLKFQLDALSGGNGINLNPNYQRGYVWNEYQKTSYVEYILRGGFSGRDIFWNAANWQGAGDVGILELVDGQQRVKTVLQFLDNKVSVFGGHFYEDFEDKLRKTNAYFNFHINNLSCPIEVVDWYLGMNTGGSVHTEDDLKIAKAFRDKLING